MKWLGGPTLTTILYIEGEWNPVLLPDEMDGAFFYDGYKDMQQMETSFASGEIQKANCLLIAAVDETLAWGMERNIAAAAYANPLFPGQTFSGCTMVIEGFEEVDADFLVRIFERFHHIPWTIAVTKRCVIREFCMEDLDALISLYDQPGVTYQLDAKGQRQPGATVCKRGRGGVSAGIHHTYVWILWIWDVACVRPHDGKSDWPGRIGTPGF
mgnify:CR=1 FL=1